MVAAKNVKELAKLSLSLWIDSIFVLHSHSIIARILDPQPKPL